MLPSYRFMRHRPPINLQQALSSATTSSYLFFGSLTLPSCLGVLRPRSFLLPSRRHRRHTIVAVIVVAWASSWWSWWVLASSSSSSWLVVFVPLWLGRPPSFGFRRFPVTLPSSPFYEASSSHHYNTCRLRRLHKCHLRRHRCWTACLLCDAEMLRSIGLRRGW